MPAFPGGWGGCRVQEQEPGHCWALLASCPPPNWVRKGPVTGIAQAVPENRTARARRGAVTSQAGLSLSGAQLVTGCRCCDGESGNGNACLAGFCSHILVNSLVIPNTWGFALISPLVHCCFGNFGLFVVKASAGAEGGGCSRHSLNLSSPHIYAGVRDCVGDRTSAPGHPLQPPLLPCCSLLSIILLFFLLQLRTNSLRACTSWPTSPPWHCTGSRSTCGDPFRSWRSTRRVTLCFGLQSCHTVGHKLFP